MGDEARISRSLTPGAVTRRSLFRGAVSIGVLGITSIGLASCSGKPEPTPSDDDATDVAAVVQIGDNFYEPVAVTVAPGQAVRWEWGGREQHDVVADDRSFVSELMREGTYTHVFDQAGEFAYLCSIHPEMRGMVTVA